MIRDGGMHSKFSELQMKSMREIVGKSEQHMIVSGPSIPFPISSEVKERRFMVNVAATLSRIDAVSLH